MVRGRRGFNCLDVLDLSAAPAPTVVEKEGGSCSCWWSSSRARSRLPPLPPPLASLPAALAVTLTEWTLLFGIRVGVALIADEEKHEDDEEDDVDKHWKRGPVRLLLLPPRPLASRSCRPPPPPPRPPPPSLFRDQRIRAVVLPADVDRGCAVAVSTAAVAAAVVVATVTPPPRQDASATAERTGVARIVCSGSQLSFGTQRRGTTQEAEGRMKMHQISMHHFV